MVVYGIDPGTINSALVGWDGSRATVALVLSNEEILHEIEALNDGFLYIEKIASYGMAVGKEVFDTCWWSGRFFQKFADAKTYASPARMIERGPVKLALCGSRKAKDANIRQALLDRCGPVGVKKQQGPLYGVKSHCWAALAVAVCGHDIENGNNSQQ